MVDEPRVIPAEDHFPRRVLIGVFRQDVAINLVHGRYLLGRESLIEIVTHPGYGAAGDGAGSEHAVTDVVIDVQQFGIGMNYCFTWLQQILGDTKGFFRFPARVFMGRHTPRVKEFIVVTLLWSAPASGAAW